MSVSERATIAAIKFGLIFIMMIIITIVQEFKIEKDEATDSCCPQENSVIIKNEEVKDSIIKFFQKDI